MKTLEELRVFYEGSLKPNLEILEKNRLEIIKKLYSQTVVILIIIGLILSFLAFFTQEPLTFFIIIPLGLIGFLILRYLAVAKFKAPFKREIIAKVVKFIDNNFNYQPDNCISQNLFMASKIFQKYPDRYHGDDYVSGKIDKTAIIFSEVHAEYKIGYVDKDGNRRETWQTLFKGLFFLADFNKNFSKTVVVLPDFAEKKFGFLGRVFQSWNIMRDKVIRLEDPEFEKEFVVYGSDPVEARYILSTSLMRRILEFKNKTKKKICLSFVDSCVFVAIGYEEDLFEPRLFSTVLDFFPIAQYFDDLKLGLAIIEELNLNTRIWSKE